MSVSTVHAVYFSGTGTTEKTVRRIARRLADKLGAAYAERWLLWLCDRRLQ